LINSWLDGTLWSARAARIAQPAATEEAFMPEAAADAKTSVDSMLADAIAKMDALTKRMDALEVGEKKIIKGDDDDDDKKSKQDGAKSSPRSDDDDDDKGKKDDGITAPKTKIKDDEKGAAKGDAGFPPGKGLKKDDDGELEIKHGKGKDDSSKKADAKKSDDDDDDDKKKKDDAFPPPKKTKADDDDDDKKDDSARADAIATLTRQIADQQSVIDRLQALIKPKSDDEHAAFADAQARADAVFSGFGERAPRPLEGEALMDYRRRLATKLKKHSSTWKGVKLSELPESAFQIAEDAVYNDAITAAANPVDLDAGELRMVTKVDPATGVRSNVFYGKESFVKQMGRPGRRVASFRTLASQ
jgi:hypothetical protein